MNNLNYLLNCAGLPLQPEVMPENVELEITLKHEVGVFRGKKIGTEFHDDVGGIWSGYWQDDVRDWKLVTKQLSKQV